MKAKFRNGQLILVDDQGDMPAIMQLLRALDGHAAAIEVRSDVCIVLEDLGPRDEACREPINITQNSDEQFVAISNLYPARFTLDGESYGSVEGFWQSLKCDSPERRREIAMLSGVKAKKGGGGSPRSASFAYQGETIATGTHAHWALMERACMAKFEQDARARRALLATGNRPLTHKVRGDSRTIPGVIMAAIWMRIRKRIQDELAHADL